MILGRGGDALRFSRLPGRESADPLPEAGALGVSVRIVRLQPGTPRRPHVHPHSCEVVHVLAGAGEAWVDGRRHPVRQGDTFVIPAGAAHATLPDPGATLELLCVFPHPDLGANLEELDEPELT